MPPSTTTKSYQVPSRAPTSKLYARYTPLNRLSYDSNPVSPRSLDRVPKVANLRATFLEETEKARIPIIKAAETSWYDDSVSDSESDKETVALQIGPSNVNGSFAPTNLGASLPHSTNQEAAARDINDDRELTYPIQLRDRSNHYSGASWDSYVHNDRGRLHLRGTPTPTPHAQPATAYIPSQPPCISPNEVGGSYTIFLNTVSAEYGDAVEYTDYWKEYAYLFESQNAFEEVDGCPVHRTLNRVGSRVRGSLGGVKRRGSGIMAGLRSRRGSMSSLVHLG